MGKHEIYRVSWVLLKEIGSLLVIELHIEGLKLTLTPDSITVTR